MAALRGLRQILCVLPLLALVACKGIEKGDRIDHLIMFDKSTTTPVALATNADFQSYICLRQQLGVIAVFEKNGSADYSDRPGAIWSSDNENVVHVSNGDDIIPSTDPTAPVRYYPKGVIKPINPGFATITVDYVGIKGSVTVHVQNPSSIILSTSPFDASSNASNLAAVSIAPNSYQQYYAYATLPNSGGQAGVSAIRDVTGNAVWTVLEDPDKTYVSITNAATGTVQGGGLVTGISSSGDLTVNAHFAACEGTSFGVPDITAKVNVSNLASLKVEHDPNFLAIKTPPYPLVVGTNEAFKVTGTLANTHQQDLSYQAVLSTKNGSAGILAFTGNLATASPLSGGLGNTLVTATFNGIDSPSILAQTQNASLNSHKINSHNVVASDINQSIPAGGFYPYHSIGEFVPASGPTFTQDMTHSVAWTSSNAAIVAIGNAGMLVGVAISQNTKQDCVTITATPLIDPSKYDFTVLGVGGVYTAGCED